MGCDEPSGRSQKEHNALNERLKMKKILENMPVSNFTVGELMLVQKFFTESDFHECGEGMKKIRNLIEKHSKKNQNVTPPVFKGMMPISV